MLTELGMLVDNMAGRQGIRVGPADTILTPNDAAHARGGQRCRVDGGPLTGWHPALHTQCEQAEATSLSTSFLSSCQLGLGPS